MNINIKKTTEFEKPIICHNKTAEERYEESYLWIDVYFSSEVAKSTPHDSDDFKRGASWYAAFRWSHLKVNEYLDLLLDSGEFIPYSISKKEFILYKHTWERRVIANGW